VATELQNKTVITKKAHQCFSCYRKFPAGTKMTYFAGIYEGNFSSIYWCDTCDSIFDLSPENEYESGFVDEMLEDGQTPEELLDILHNERIKKLRNDNSTKTF
jgi:hypothetical protein